MIELDDETFAQVAQASNHRHLSVEEFIRQQAKRAVAAMQLDISNDAHRKITAALNRSEADYESPRDALHDRERSRAETYTENRKSLLDLIDSSMGDMGVQGWNRAGLYDA